MNSDNHGASGRLLLHAPAPDFEATTSQGPLRLYEWERDKWVVLFSHPADFTPVCTSEFVAFGRLQEEFRKREVALLGSSIDSVFSHIAWVRSIKQHFDVDLRFPIIADLDMKVARLYGMLHEPSSSTAAVRGVFVIDPKRKLKAMLYYPMQVGRNIEEILRLVDALRTAERHGVATPADWRPGQKVVIPPPSTVAGAEERLHSKEYEVTDWYYSRRQV